MEILKKKSAATELLILLELVEKLPTSQRSVSEPLDITPQAVSDYIKRMASRGLVEITPSGPRATVEGVELLQHQLLSLKEFVDRSVQNLDIIRTTDAVADANIKGGDRVSLYMKEGLLMVGRGSSNASMGTADHGAEPGDMVSISSLSGVIEMGDPALVLIEIRPAREGGGKDRIGIPDLENMLVEIAQGKKDIIDEGRKAAMDLEAAAFMRRSGIDYRMDIPEPRALLSPLRRGLDVIAFGTPYSISRVARDLEYDLEGFSVKRITSVELSGRLKG